MTYQPTGLALEIFQSRHAAHPHETWMEGCARVATHIANAEDGALRSIWRDKFEIALFDNLFMPGGRIWYGSGRARGQLLNCFVVGTKDSREGWGRTVSDSIIISGTGGGVGINFSPTRPRGMAIRGTGGTATGAVSEMEMVNSVGNVIKAGGGRRTALMFALSLNHGDILEFMDKKLDRGELNNANVSVLFDDDPEKFFKLVRDKSTWDLTHNGQVIGTISAAELWERLVSNAIKPRAGQGGGEPGLLNKYLANRMSNIWYVEELTSTNPCLTPDTRIATDRGMLRIEDMAKMSRNAQIVADRRVGKGDDLDPDAFGMVVLPAVNVELKQRNAPVFKVTTEHGYTVTATSEHTFVTTTGRKRLHELVEGDVLLLPSGEGAFGSGHTYNKGLLLGMYVSDDTSTFNKWLSDLADNEQIALLKSRIPESVWRGSRDFVQGYIQGLFQNNGSLIFEGPPTQVEVFLKLARLNHTLLEDVQRLLTVFGIVSKLRREKDQFELVIDHSNMITFQFTVGMFGHKKYVLANALDKHGTAYREPERFITTITLIENAGTSDVYCLTQPETNCIVSDGIVNGQCGEIWLSPYDCCCLGAVVLPRFVKNEKMQWDLLRETVATGVRFLDNVLTVNQFPLQEIADKCTQLRRIGLGVTGLHHMLLEMGLGYNEPSGLEFVDKLMGFIKNASYEASTILAAEKGSFPAFRTEQFLQSKFVKTLKPSVRAKIETHGMRNCALNTIAPVGTGSMVCDVSSAIEPIFAVAHERRFRRGDVLAKEVVLDPMFARFQAEGRDTSHFLGAHEISMRDHFEMQRTCQRHIDNAVSKTINAPANTSVEELSALYMEYFPELKGVTVYPDGSREDQPLTPLSREEAVRLADEAVSQATSQDACRSGSCDL